MSYLFSLREVSAANGGVLSSADLAVVLGRPNGPRTAEAIRRLVRDGILGKIRRGLYVDLLNGYRPEVVGQRWLAPSYLSAEAALVRHGLCQKGIRSFTFVTPRLIAARSLATKDFGKHRFLYRHIARRLFFGFKRVQGIRLATPEKAVIDFLYFVFKGQRSAITPEEINFSALNGKLFRRHLRRYRQPGFEMWVLFILGGWSPGKRKHQKRR